MRNKKFILFLSFVLFLLASCVPQKGMMEEQTGGTDTEDSEYTEFAAKQAGSLSQGSFKLVIHMEGTGEGQVAVDDIYICKSSEKTCEIIRKEAAVVLKAVYDAAKYSFHGFEGVNCSPAEPQDPNVCHLVLGNVVTVVVATFY